MLPFPDPGCRGAFKANQDRRHRIPKQRHRVANWAAYDAALRRRGSLTVWKLFGRDRGGARRPARSPPAHAAALLWLRAGRQGHDLRLIQDHLGHRDPWHTVHYTRTADRRFEGLWR